MLANCAANMFRHFALLTVSTSILCWCSLDPKANLSQYVCNDLAKDHVLLTLDMILQSYRSLRRVAASGPGNEPATREGVCGALGRV